jgi:hypothetical protein
VNKISFTEKVVALSAGEMGSWRIMTTLAMMVQTGGAPAIALTTQSSAGGNPVNRRAIALVNHITRLHKERKIPLEVFQRLMTNMGLQRKPSEREDGMSEGLGVVDYGGDGYGDADPALAAAAAAEVRAAKALTERLKEASTHSEHHFELLGHDRYRLAERGLCDESSCLNGHHVLCTSCSAHGVRLCAAHDRTRHTKSACPHFSRAVCVEHSTRVRTDHPLEPNHTSNHNKFSFYHGCSSHA